MSSLSFVAKESMHLGKKRDLPKKTKCTKCQKTQMLFSLVLF